MNVGRTDWSRSSPSPDIGVVSQREVSPFTEGQVPTSGGVGIVLDANEVRSVLIG